MLFKIISLFLVAMIALAIFGRLRFPMPKVRLPGKPKGLAKPGTCKRCGAFIIGKDGCNCDKPASGKGPNL